MKFRLHLVGFVMALGVAPSLPAATFQTANFSVTAETLPLAREIAHAAETWRTKLARNWLTATPDQWSFRCRIQVTTQKNGGSGWTSYHFLGGEVSGVGIRMQGPRERILEYVLPHELTHAVLVTAFGKAMPRWADEGAAMLSESQSQKLRQRLVVEQLVDANELIPVHQLLQMIDYPRDRKLHAFYAQSVSLSEYLISRGGRARFLKFVRDGYSTDWNDAIHRHYQSEDAETLQGEWKTWVVKKADVRNSHNSPPVLASE